MTTMLRHRLTSTAALTGVALWAASLGLYITTLAPTLSWGFNGIGVDGGELLAAAKNFGVAHPPGYPTYTLLLKAFATLVLPSLRRRHANAIRKNRPALYRQLFGGAGGKNTKQLQHYIQTGEGGGYDPAEEALLSLLGLGCCARACGAARGERHRE